jgi:ankyrin repeat protein
MNINSFLSRLSHSPIPRLAMVTLIVLACSTPALCGDIHEAVKAGDLAKVKSMLKRNPELVYSNRDYRGYTPLHYAAEGHIDVAKFLLANGADINAMNRRGETALHVAAGAGSKDVVALLLASFCRKTPFFFDGEKWRC